MSPELIVAEWKRLVMLNYPIEPRCLEAYLPYGTELDVWDGTTYISLVAFQFLNTKVAGLPVPFHREFEEINLRFYVRARGPSGWRRGVVFIREVVPSWAVAAAARWLYNEQYVAYPTRSRVFDPSADSEGCAEYGWKYAGKWLTITTTFFGVAARPKENSLEEFITEHYWGYSAQKRGGTVEYRVEHPQWEVWEAVDTRLDGDIPGFYGAPFSSALTSSPSSVFVARGSEVTVKRGQRIDQKK